MIIRIIPVKYLIELASMIFNEPYKTRIIEGFKEIDKLSPLI